MATSGPAPSLDDRCIDSIRVLAMDAVEKAKSGHPGTPMALAPLAYLLWTRHLKHDPADPQWLGRDRFVLSCGHASMLLYAVLHLSGYDLDVEDLRQFRQWESRTPGHPEYGHTPGVETTTGPLGQGVGNAVGMALAATHLARVFGRPGHDVLDQRIWFLASDGDLMEGVSHEAASLAGHLRLGRLIGFYDDNRITIDGSTDLTLSDDVKQRFRSYGWHVQEVDDGNDLDALDGAIRRAMATTEQPSLIVLRTQIAYGSPNKQNTSEAHGSPLGEAEVQATRANLNWKWEEPFFVPQEVRETWRACRERGARLQQEWQERYAAYASAHADAARELERRLRGELPAGWDDSLPQFAASDSPMATRAASGRALNALCTRLPELLGGSADLAPSNNTWIQDSGSFDARDAGQRNLHFGVREHAMGAILNGMALQGGVIPYGGTFLVFSDYMRPSVRLAALMRLGVIYVYTHDSIGLGEDGPTHQPVEHLAALRCIPNLVVLRPADAAETVEAWRWTIQHRRGPVALVLSRQKLPHLQRPAGQRAAVARGGYVLREAAGGEPEIVFVASGSEVSLALETAQRLQGRAVRVVSMPSLELFASQERAYRESLLPRGVPTLALEAAHPMSWHRWVGSRGDVVGVESFGASAPQAKLLAEYGFTPEDVEERARRLLEGR
jgi:transketolase